MPPLWGLDALVFTGGIGENAEKVREKSLEGLDFIGVKLDMERNLVKSSEEREITSDDSRVRAFVIPTNEELVIALETKQIVENLDS